MRSRMIQGSGQSWVCLPFWRLGIAGIGATGAFGVSLFFVLSSYLITELLLREKDLMGTLDIRSFYIRRILRIWPLYFAFLALAVALAVDRARPAGDVARGIVVLVAGGKLVHHLPRISVVGDLSAVECFDRRAVLHHVAGHRSQGE